MTACDASTAIIHIQGLVKILHMSKNEDEDSKQLIALFNE
jgi:hypothetical protein